MSNKNKFLSAINEFFGYEIQNIQQFERDLKADFDEYHRYQELFNFLYWYERKLTKQESEDKCIGSKSIQEQYKEISKRNDAYDGEMNSLRRQLDDVKKLLEAAVRANKGLKLEIEKSYRDIDELQQDKVDLDKLAFDLGKEIKALKQYIKNGIEFGYIDDREGNYKKFI